MQGSVKKRLYSKCNLRGKLYDRLRTFGEISDFLHNGFWCAMCEDSELKVTAFRPLTRYLGNDLSVFQSSSSAEICSILTACKSMAALLEFWKVEKSLLY